MHVSEKKPRKQTEESEERRRTFRSIASCNSVNTIISCSRFSHSLQIPIRSMDSSAVIRSSHCTLPLSLSLSICVWIVNTVFRWMRALLLCVFFLFFFISDLRVLPFPVWFFIFEERKCFRLSGTCTFFFCKFRCYSVFSQRVKASCFECLWITDIFHSCIYALFALLCICAKPRDIWMYINFGFKCLTFLVLLISYFFVKNKNNYYCQEM